MRTTAALNLIMPLTLTLDTHGEELVSAYLRSGMYRWPEEVVARAPGNPRRRGAPSHAQADDVAR